jgi:hypothetical protein
MVRVDLRGHGLSAKPDDVAAFREKAGKFNQDVLAFVKSLQR